MPVRIYDIAKKLGIESKDVLAKAKELEMPALAITDHGNLFGVPEFYTKTKKSTKCKKR